MRKEAMQANLEPARMFLDLCRSGEIEGNGYNLFIHSDILNSSGVSFRAQGTNLEEVRRYLVEDLRCWVRRIKEGNGDPKGNSWDLILLRAYFLKDDSGEGPLLEISLEELGLTKEELERMEKEIDFKLSQQRG